MEIEDTLKAITFLKGSNRSYFPSARVISGLYHAYTKTGKGPKVAGKSTTMVSLIRRREI